MFDQNNVMANAPAEDIIGTEEAIDGCSNENTANPDTQQANEDKHPFLTFGDKNKSILSEPNENATFDKQQTDPQNAIMP